MPIVEDKSETANNQQPTNEPSHPIGTVINSRYEIEGLIGKGRLTCVYLAVDKINQAKCAVKVNRVSLKGSPLLDTVISSAHIMQSLNHPALPKVFDICNEENFIYIIMEYVEGVNLEQLLSHRGKPFSSKETAKIGIQVAQALSYMHLQVPPVIHRDIKPCNLIMGPSEIVRVVDLGIAVRKMDGMTDDMVMGTNGYAPLEQYAGNTAPQSDIYALGITMYHLVTGISPTMPTWTYQPIRSHNRSLSRRLEKIINKCVVKDFNQRYPSADALIADLKKV